MTVEKAAAVSLEHVKDIYNTEVVPCTELVDLYDKSARQLFDLAEAWDSFKNRRRKPMGDDDTGRAAYTLNYHCGLLNVGVRILATMDTVGYIFN